VGQCEGQAVKVYLERVRRLPIAGSPRKAAKEY